MWMCPQDTSTIEFTIKSDDPALYQIGYEDTRGLNEFVLKELTKLATSSLPCEFLLKRMRRMLPGCPRWVGINIWDGMHAAENDPIVIDRADIG